MWSFFGQVLKLLQKIGWKKIWQELVKIPASLKYTLLAAIIIWIGYFGYQKLFENDELTNLKSNVEELTEKVNVAVESDDYRNDLAYLVTAIKLLESENYYFYKEEQDQLGLIKQFINKEHPNDPIVDDVDAMVERNKLEYETVHMQFMNAMRGCSSKIATDSTYIYMK